MSTQVYELPNGKKLRRWTDEYGRKWACSEYDHGPFCRRCQPVDDVTETLLDLVVDGAAELRQNPDTAEFEISLTDAGMAQAKHVLKQALDDQEGDRG